MLLIRYIYQVLVSIYRSIWAVLAVDYIVVLLLPEYYIIKINAYENFLLFLSCPHDGSPYV